MLDFKDIVQQPNVDIKYYQAATNTGTSSWSQHRWQKPRGVSWIYMLVVGGGGPGGYGLNQNSGTVYGGGGGSSGGMNVVMLPAPLVPDTLSVYCGYGGSSNLANNGMPTFISLSITPSITEVNYSFAYAPGGNTGNYGASLGTGGAAPAAATIANCCLAGRGFYAFYAGAAGGNGGSTGAGSSVAMSTGLLVTGGAGGGAGASIVTTGQSAGNGGGISSLGMPFGRTVYPNQTATIPGGTGATYSSSTGLRTPATAASSFLSAALPILMNYGGTGGGGGSLDGFGDNLLAPSPGGNGAPGCGGGGGGGASTLFSTALQSGGAGGPGFAYIISF